LGLGENSLKSLGALGEGTVAFVAVRCGPNPIKLIVFFQKAKPLRKKLLFPLKFFVFLAESLNPAGRIHQFLLACEKRVAF